MKQPNDFYIKKSQALSAAVRGKSLADIVSLINKIKPLEIDLSMLWKSVDDPPKKTGRYLVRRCNMLDGHENIEILYWGKPDNNLFKHEGLCFYIYDSEWGDVVIDDVTHWMPLPKGLKVKK